MILSISDKANENYLAKVVKLPAPHKHPNADKLQLVTIDGYTVITGLNAVEGQLYVYFPAESVLCHEYLSWSNSYSDANLNNDQKIKGYFDRNGRVRCVKLRDQISEGYIVPFDDIVK